MPELPEVETVRLSILPEIQGRIIGSLQILTPGVWLSDGTDPVGWRIDDVSRRGKYLIFALSGGQKPVSLICHLRMTGRLLLQTEELPPQKHTHVRMRLDPVGARTDSKPIWLDYVDPRRFGRLWLLAGESADLPKGLANLGPEPLTDDFNAEILAAKLEGRQLTIKAMLLDQGTVAGLGNIYADESLFASGLNPARRASSLTIDEIGRLAGAVSDVLGRAIDCCGTTLRDYADGWNRKGKFQECLMVYGRAGEPCRRCGETIRLIRLAGRSTCFCPACQPGLPEMPGKAQGRGAAT